MYKRQGQETEYQEDVREFLFTYQGYDYFLRIHEEKTGDGGGPLRKEIIRTTGNGSVEVLDTLVAGSTQGPEASDQTFRVVLAGGRLLYPGMKDDSAQAMKDSRLISINLDGSDRQTAGEDRMPYGVFHQLCTDNGYVYFEGWTNAGEFPRPIYRATPDLRTIEKIGDIDGSLLTVYDLSLIHISPPDLRLTGKCCNFYNRCPYVTEKCCNQVPPLVEVEEGHFVACHRQNKENKLVRGEVNKDE